MFPVHNGSSYPSFPYWLNYQLFSQSLYSQNLNTYNDPSVSLNDQINGYNFQTNNQSQYFAIRTNFMQQKLPKYVKNQKRIIKKLNNLAMKQRFKSIHKILTSEKKSFKYFDPSRAPPISSLRNNDQLQADLKISLLNTKYKELNVQSTKQIEQSILKQQILLKQPKQAHYPFLICKKRKNFRNIKRRYSVAYFEQRALFIKKKLPIPQQLHPKNKNKRHIQSDQSSEEINGEKNMNKGDDQMNLKSEVLGSPTNRNTNKKNKVEMNQQMMLGCNKFDIKCQFKQQ